MLLSCLLFVCLPLQPPICPEVEALTEGHNITSWQHDWRWQERQRHSQIAPINSWKIQWSQMPLYHCKEVLYTVCTYVLGIHYTRDGNLNQAQLQVHAVWCGQYAGNGQHVALQQRPQVQNRDSGATHHEQNKVTEQDTQYWRLCI